MTWYEGFEKGQWKALNKPNPKVVQDKKDAKHGDLWPDPNTNCLYMNMGHKWMCVNDPNNKKRQNEIEKRIKDINERYKYEQWQKGYSFGKKIILKMNIHTMTLCRKLRCMKVQMGILVGCNL